MSLAQHLEDRYLKPLPEVEHQTTHHEHIPFLNTTAQASREVHQNVTTATKRVTGHTPAQGGSDQQPAYHPHHRELQTNETVEYNSFISLFSSDNKSEFKISNTKFRVGSLAENITFWRDTLHANAFVLNVVEFGYFIPFISIPTQVFLKNNASAYKHSSFVETAIESLL